MWAGAGGLRNFSVAWLLEFRRSAWARSLPTAKINVWCVSWVELIDGRTPAATFFGLFAAYAPALLVSCCRILRGFHWTALPHLVSPSHRVGTHSSAAPCHPASMTGEAGPIYPLLLGRRHVWRSRQLEFRSYSVGCFTNECPLLSLSLFCPFVDSNIIRPSPSYERILEPSIFALRESATVPKSRIDRQTVGKKAWTRLVCRSKTETRWRSWLYSLIHKVPSGNGNGHACEDPQRHTAAKLRVFTLSQAHKQQSFDFSFVFVFV